WVGTYLCFLLVCEPYNTIYRLFYLAPLLACLALAARATGARPLAFLAAALALELLAIHLPKNAGREQRATGFRAQTADALARGHRRHLWRVRARSVDYQLFQPAGLLDTCGAAGCRPRVGLRRAVCARPPPTLRGLDVPAKDRPVRLAIPLPARRAASALNGAGAAQGVLDRSTERHK